MLARNLLVLLTLFSMSGCFAKDSAMTPEQLADADLEQRTSPNKIASVTVRPARNANSRVSIKIGSIKKAGKNTTMKLPAGSGPAKMAWDSKDRLWVIYDDTTMIAQVDAQMTLVRPARPNDEEFRPAGLLASE